MTGAVLFINAGDGRLLCFNLTGTPVTLGRNADNDVTIPRTVPGGETVSRCHARLYYNHRLEKWVVKDLESTNGTYVEGKRTGHNFLWDGVRISFGGVDGRFETSRRSEAE